MLVEMAVSTELLDMPKVYKRSGVANRVCRQSTLADASTKQRSPSDERWWQHCNIFGLGVSADSQCTFDERRERLKSNPIEKNDLDDFAAYITKALPAAAPRIRASDEDRMESFVKLCMVVLEQLYQGSDAALRHAFHFVLLLRTRIYGFQPSKDHPRQQKMLDTLIEQHSGTTTPVGHTMGDPAAKATSLGYWNYAWAAQELRDRCNGKTGRPPCNCERAAFVLGFTFGQTQSPDKHSWSCPKRRYLQMLHTFQLRAWGETRCRVLLTAGRRLPAELCEKVFEFALVAEQIPSDPRVFSSNWRPALDKDDRYCSKE